MSDISFVIIAGITHDDEIGLASDGYSVVVSDLPTKKDALTSVREECLNIYKAHPQGSLLTAIQVECDVTAEDQVDKLVDTAVKELGGIKVVSLIIK